jgi:hypothetical protein
MVCYGSCCGSGGGCKVVGGGYVHSLWWWRQLQQWKAVITALTPVLAAKIVVTKAAVALRDGCGGYFKDLGGWSDGSVVGGYSLVAMAAAITAWRPRWLQPVLRIRIRDTEIGFFRITDPGSQTHIFDSLMTFFGVKSTIILCKLAQSFFFTCSKKKKF